MAVAVAPARRPLAAQLAQWRVWLPVYGRALALQASEPTVAAAVVQHSSVFDDPLGRLARTTAGALPFLFGDDDTRKRAANQLRARHRAIAGRRDDGQRYHAWDRDVWTWVHLTTAAAMLYGLEVSCGPLAEGDREAFYAACRTTGTLYGVRARDMPDDVAGLRDYVDAGIETRLRPNPATARLQEAVAARTLFDALARRLPWPLRQPVRQVTRVAAGSALHTVLFGAFPDGVRRLWGVGWGPLDEARYRTLLLAARLAAAGLPNGLRYVPEARKAPGWA